MGSFESLVVRVDVSAIRGKTAHFTKNIVYTEVYRRGIAGTGRDSEGTARLPVLQELDSAPPSPVAGAQPVSRNKGSDKEGRFR